MFTRVSGSNGWVSGRDVSDGEGVIGMAAAQSSPDSGDPPNPAVSNTPRPSRWAGSGTS
jgi:hypothetical protein